ncbi:hypothetical protein BCR44DRAFT_1011484 [Catenaria anguillulae PL171]|uniref:Uncharacterized protein n=1 Tax=Catenaria anguillulae PL171 TaxID=765915 RepID=A0A1Y2I822_9FUNG|nr:hypothetical protein BCR44DRAFT_1011484 [Catenaria anguillulae PL171]
MTATVAMAAVVVAVAAMMSATAMTGTTTGRVAATVGMAAPAAELAAGVGTMIAITAAGTDLIACAPRSFHQASRVPSTAEVELTTTATNAIVFSNTFQLQRHVFSHCKFFLPHCLFRFVVFISNCCLSILFHVLFPSLPLSVLYVGVLLCPPLNSCAATRFSCYVKSVPTGSTSATARPAIAQPASHHSASQPSPSQSSDVKCRRLLSLTSNQTRQLFFFQIQQLPLVGEHKPTVRS